MSTDLIVSQIWIVGAIVKPGPDWDMVAIGVVFLISATCEHFRWFYRKTP